MSEREDFLSKITPENPYYLAVMALVQQTAEKLNLKSLDEVDENLRFGLALKLARKSKGMTQVELAQRTQIDSSYISRIERGENSPPARDLTHRLADALEFPDRMDRFYFVALAGCAGMDDIKGTKFEKIFEDFQLFD
jgi:transcriptional regulator with XRE-family HTH domain